MVKFPGLKFVQRNLKIYVTGRCNNEASGYFVSRKSGPKVFRKIMLPVAFAPKGIGANISN